MDRSSIQEIEPQRRRRLVALVAAVLGAGLIAFLVYKAFFSGGGATETPFEPYTVGTMTLRNMVTTSGLAIAQDEAVLGFPVPGQIKDIFVDLGDQVTYGQPLIAVKADELENAVAAAESALEAAELTLLKMLEGATEAEIDGAEEVVATARAALTKAQNDLNDALDPPDEAELTAADQAIAAAAAALSAAQGKLDTLRNGASDAEIAAAEASLVQAETSYSQAETAEEDAEENEDNAQSGFEYAAETYCGIDGCLQDICDFLESTAYMEPLDADQVDQVVEVVEPTPRPTRTPGPSPTPTDTATPLPTDVPTPTRTPRPTLEAPDELEESSGNLVYANTTYRNAITAVANAEDALRAAEASLNAAELALDDLLDGASTEDITAAEDAVKSAQAQVDAAYAARDELVNGPSNTTVENLESAISKARAGYLAAVSARDELVAGATHTEIALQEQDVRQAELGVDKARDTLDDATLTSPFDGVVSALPVKLGQFVNNQTAAVTILTPGLLVLELNIGETELADIKVGQTGGVIFDAIPAKPYPIRIAAIGLSPTTEQGVVIYKVRATIFGLNDPNSPVPVPGMNGSASVITQQQPNVVAIPSAAVRLRGGQKVVEALVNGKIELRPVETGLEDGENIEIVKGLSVGDVIAMRTLGGQTKDAEKDELPAGIR